MEKQIRVNNSQLSTAISFIKQHLDHEGIAGEEKNRAILMAEESLVHLFAHSDSEAWATIKVRYMVSALQAERWSASGNTT